MDEYERQAVGEEDEIERKLRLGRHMELSPMWSTRWRRSQSESADRFSSCWLSTAAAGRPLP